MPSPETGGPSVGRWRVVVLAMVFALLAQGCFVAAVMLTRNPF
jgi:hypothetical protein